MATTFDYIGNNKHVTLTINLNRQQYAPLDGSSVFKTKKDFEYYLSQGSGSSEGVSDYVRSADFKKYPYVGQIVSYIDDGKVVVVKITSVTGTQSYEKIGSNSLTNQYNDESTIGQIVSDIMESLGGSYSYTDS